MSPGDVTNVTSNTTGSNDDDKKSNRTATKAKEAVTGNKEQEEEQLNLQAIETDAAGDDVSGTLTLHNTYKLSYYNYTYKLSDFLYHVTKRTFEINDQRPKMN